MKAPTEKTNDNPSINEPTVADVRRGILTAESIDISPSAPKSRPISGRRMRDPQTTNFGNSGIMQTGTMIEYPKWTIKPPPGGEKTESASPARMNESPMAKRVQ